MNNPNCIETGIMLNKNKIDVLICINCGREMPLDDVDFIGFYENKKYICKNNKCKIDSIIICREMD